MASGFFRGTSLEQDGRWSNKSKKLLKQMKFPEVYGEKIDMRKVKLQVLIPWISKRITELLGFEDEVLINFVQSMLEDETFPDPRQMQINLTEFLNKEAERFTKELWEFLLSAQNEESGIPRQLLFGKMQELQQRRADASSISAQLAQTQAEAAVQHATIAAVRAQMESAAVQQEIAAVASDAAGAPATSNSGAGRKRKSRWDAVAPDTPAVSAEVPSTDAHTAEPSSIPATGSAEATLGGVEERPGELSASKSNGDLREESRRGSRDGARSHRSSSRERSRRSSRDDSRRRSSHRDSSRHRRRSRRSHSRERHRSRRSRSHERHRSRHSRRSRSASRGRGEERRRSRYSVSPSPERKTRRTGEDAASRAPASPRIADANRSVSPSRSRSRSGSPDSQKEEDLKVLREKALGTLQRRSSAE